MSFVEDISSCTVSAGTDANRICMSNVVGQRNVAASRNGLTVTDGRQEGTALAAPRGRNHGGSELEWAWKAEWGM